MIGIRAPGRIEKRGIRGERCPGTRAESPPGVPEPIHCPGPAGFRPGPIGALGLGQLARGTEPGPMVPTVWFCFLCFLATKRGRVRKVEDVIGSLKPLPTAA